MIYVIGARSPHIHISRTERILIDINIITAIVKIANRVELADVSLRIANERLMEENVQLQEQVREYERWMEFIMTKFRLQNVRDIARFIVSCCCCFFILFSVFHMVLVCLSLRKRNVVYRCPLRNTADIISPFFTRTVCNGAEQERSNAGSLQDGRARRGMFD